MNQNQIINLIGNIKLELSRLESFVQIDENDPVIAQGFNQISNLISTFEVAQNKTFEYKVLTGSDLCGRRVLAATEVTEYNTEMAKTP